MVHHDDRQEGSQDAAYRNPGVDNRVVVVAPASGSELGHDRASGGQKRADAQAGDKAQGTEDRNGVCQGRQAHAKGEPGDASDHDVPPAQVVTDGAGDQGTDHDTQQGPAPHHPCSGGADFPELGWVAQQGGDDGAVDDQVVSVEDQCNGGDGHHPTDGVLSFPGVA